MKSINPYLTFNGNCEEAFNHYKSVFGGEFASVNRFNEMPPQEGGPKMSRDEGNKIMHISLNISQNMVLLGSDTGGEWSKGFAAGTNFSLSIDAENKKEADKIYAALANGGKKTMPMENTFWGSYFGMCMDKFGISWMISAQLDQPE